MPFTFPSDSTSKVGAVRVTADTNNFYMPIIQYTNDGVTPLLDTAAHSGFVKLSDGTNTATLGIFHNGDGQSISGTSYGILTGGVDQLFNGTTMDRKRSVQGIADANAGVGLEASGNYLFNGTTWDKMRTVVAAADAWSGTGAEISGLIAFNGTTYDRVRTIGVADGASTGILAQGNYGYNGTTWDRMRTAATSADGVATQTLGALQVMAVQSLFNGTTFDRGRSVGAIGDANAGTGMQAGGNYNYNGTNWDRNYNNFYTTIQASTAKTATFSTANQTNYNFRGAIITLNVTAVSGTTPTLALQINDVNGFAYSTPSTNITATGVYKFVVYPNTLSGLANSIGMIQLPLPRQFTINNIIGGTTPSFTYSIIVDWLL